MRVLSMRSLVGGTFYCQIRQTPQSTVIDEVIHRVHHLLKGIRLPGWVVSMSKKEQGDCTENIFCTTQGKRYSSGARRCGMVLIGMVLTLAGDNWVVGVSYDLSS